MATGKTPAGAIKYDNAEEEKLTPENLNLDEWVNGLLPVKRACTIYARVDLLAVLDTARERIRIAKKHGQDTSEIEAEAREAAEQIEQTALTIVVQAWSQAKIKRFADDMKAKGVTDVDEIGLHQIAAQVVSPAGFTADTLRVIEENSPQQASLIVQTVVNANTKNVDVNVPF